MNNEEGANTNYFIIDNKNSFTFNESSTSTLNQLVNSIETNKEAINENKNEISHLILKIIHFSKHNNTSDYSPKKHKHQLMQTNFDLCTNISRAYINKGTDYKKELELAMNSILNNSYSNNDFNFTDENIDNISIVLFYSFYKMYMLGKQFKIYSQVEFNKAIDKILDNNIEVVQSFLIKNQVLNKSLTEVNQTGIDDSNSKSPLNNKSMMNESINSTGIESNSSFIKSQYDIKSYYSYALAKEEKYPLPKVLIALLNKFCVIKRINISIDDFKEEKMLQWLIILLNVNSLFPHLIEVNYTIVSNTMTTLFNSPYENDIKNKQKEYCESLSSHVSASMYFSHHCPEAKVIQTTNEPIESKNSIEKTWFKFREKTQKRLNEVKSFSLKAQKEIASLFKSKDTNDSQMTLNDTLKDLSIIKQMEHKLAFIIIIPYYISQWERVRVLNIVFNDSFNKEIELALQQDTFFQKNCLFTSYFLFFRKLVQFTVNFNALDSVSFNSIILIILNCIKLKHLALVLFSPEEYYSCGSLFKLCKQLDINTAELFNNESILEVNNMSDDLSLSMINKMLTEFCFNLDCLFNTIKLLSYSLTDFDLTINLPSLIKDSDLYNTVLIKFILNIFIFITNDKHIMNSVKIAAPQLAFNNRKYPLIDQFLESLDDDNNNNKLNTIRRLHIQLRFISVVNVSKIIMRNLRILFIGDLDVESFQAFTKYYISKEYRSLSQLLQLSISLSVAIIDLKDIRNDFMALYQYYPNDLVELKLYSNLILIKEELRSIFSIINYNSVEKYVFHLNKNQEEDNTLINNDNKALTQLYQTASVTRMKIQMIYSKMLKTCRSNNKDIKCTKLKNALYTFRDFLSDVKEVLFEK